MERRTVRLFVSGRVQGVGFRAWTLDRATALGLDGWVRNRVDGRVEILASGAAAAVVELIEAAHRGPRSARVTGIDISEDTEVTRSGFRDLPTV